MVVSDQVKIVKILLQFYPVFKRADVVPNMQESGRSHSAQNSFFRHEVNIPEILLCAGEIELAATRFELVAAGYMERT